MNVQSLAHFFLRGTCLLLWKQGGDDRHGKRWSDPGCIWRYSHLDFLTDWRWGVIKTGGNSDFQVGKLSKVGERLCHLLKWETLRG